MATRTAQRQRSTAKVDLPEVPWELPPLPPILTQPLGLEGWTSLEPVLLAALASGDPMLLVGAHGSAKSFLLERLAAVLGLEYRFYNASLLNYDDLVGIPMPNQERTGLTYLSTPSAIWDAEVVFVDELNRTRPDLQNKIFPIIHERRVQGIQLVRLRYRWAAMNPPPSAEAADEQADLYLGAEPLDPSLADRFAFLIRVPDWQSLTDAERKRVLCDQFTGEHTFTIAPADLVALATDRLALLQQAPPPELADYVVTVIAQLHKQKRHCSTRRATMLHRNILAVHAARMALYQASDPEVQISRLDWNVSAALALQNSLPHSADATPIDPVDVLAIHRQAWALCRLDDDNPWRTLLRISDPLDRCVEAVRLKDAVNDSDLSNMVLTAVSAQETPEAEAAVSLAVYLALHRTRDLRPTVYETLAKRIRLALVPQTRSWPSGDCPKHRQHSVAEACAALASEATPATQIRNHYTSNLLKSLQYYGYANTTPLKVQRLFTDLWDRFDCGGALAEGRGPDVH